MRQRSSNAIGFDCSLAMRTEVVKQALELGYSRRGIEQLVKKYVRFVAYN